MKSYLPFLIGALCLLASCMPEDETPEVCGNLAPPDYYPLAVGNYWVYNWYVLARQNKPERFYLKDTLEITGIEEINGEEYYRLERNQRSMAGSLAYRRDSSGHIVDEQGNIYFTTEKQGDVFSTINFGPVDNPIVTVAYDLEEAEEKIEVPAGTFTCLLKTGSLIYPDPEDTALNRKTLDYLTPGLGEVKGIRLFASPGSPGVHEYRLVDYYIQN